MYQLNQYLEIQDTKGNYIPAPFVESINIERSIKNLADFATVTCAMFHLNSVMIFKESFDDEGDPQNKIYKLYKRGQKIKIHLGYDDNLKTEFVGFIREVKTTDNSMIIECEDELFIFRDKKVPNKQFNEVSVKKIARYVCDKINPKIKVICDYDMNYEKFTIHDANGYDVLKQIQEDTGADIFFRSSISDQIGKKTNNLTIVTSKQIEQPETPLTETVLELNIRMPYLKNRKFDNNVDYSFQHNIESGQLEYIDTTDKKVKVRIKTSNINGTTQEVEYGNTGGEDFEFKVNRINNAEMKKRAKIEFDRLMQPGYSGSFTAWLVPYVEPNYSIGIYDKDFPEKNGVYSVESVKTEFSEAGGKRTITPGIKLSKNETETNILSDSLKKN